MSDDSRLDKATEFLSADPADDRQTQAEASMFSCSIELTEAIKNKWQKIARDPATVIGNNDPRVAVDAFQSHIDAASARSEFN